MSNDMTARLSSRRDALRYGGALGLVAATGTALARTATAQDATPEAGGLSESIQTVTLSAAATMLEAAEQKAMELGVPMAIAIVDATGLLKAFHRMDGLHRSATVDLVQSKAYTSASFRTPTHVLAENAAENPAFLASLTAIPGFTLIGGGFPIAVDDMVIGGIGAGGGSPEQDMEVSQAALDALQG